MRRTGKQALHTRIREGEKRKQLYTRARDKYALVRGDFPEDYIDSPDDSCQDTSNPLNGEKPC